MQKHLRCHHTPQHVGRFSATTAPNGDLLKAAHVPVQVAAVPPQVQDRVHDQLPRSVERHLAAALHAEEGQRRGVRREQQVLLAAARACRRMLGQE